MLTGEAQHKKYLESTRVPSSQYGAGFALVASFGGAPEHPSWYRNLQKNPEASVQIEDRVIPVTASTVAAEEKER